MNTNKATFPPPTAESILMAPSYCHHQDRTRSAAGALPASQLPVLPAALPRRSGFLWFWLSKTYACPASGLLHTHVFLPGVLMYICPQLTYCILFILRSPLRKTKLSL